MQRTSKGRHVRRRARRHAVSPALALAPLLALSTSTSAYVVTVDAGPDAAEPAAPSRPAVVVPDSPLLAPVSPTRVSLRRGPGLVDAALSRPTLLGVPAPALTAYRRAAAVMGAADAACHLPWELLAAIGRVESNHGSYGDSSLDASGVTRPAIVGRPLDGHGRVSRIPDTDAGQLDGDRRWDRAVGPMQFIPGTWRLVGVDADGDGRRDPQDIDDAALAAAVYLCAGSADLGTTAGREDAVHRYNHDDDYVALVLRLFEGYVAAAADGIAALRASEVVDLAVTPVRDGRTGDAADPSAELVPHAPTAGTGPDDVPAFEPGPGDPTDEAPKDPGPTPDPDPTGEPGPDPKDEPLPEPGGCVTPVEVVPKDEPTNPATEPGEPTPSESAPSEPAPSEPTPSEPTPSEPTPSEPTPSEPTPSEPTPSEPAPSEPTPGDEEPDPCGTPTDEAPPDAEPPVEQPPAEEPTGDPAPDAQP